MVRSFRRGEWWLAHFYKVMNTQQTQPTKCCGSGIGVVVASSLTIIGISLAIIGVSIAVGAVIGAVVGAVMNDVASGCAWGFAAGAVLGSGIVMTRSFRAYH